MSKVEWGHIGLIGPHLSMFLTRSINKYKHD
jgi:hypothetical protein